MDNISLIGMPGSGKSSVGIRLARALGCRFLDVDRLIEEQEGKPLQEVLDEQGTEAFLDTEGRVIQSIQCHHTIIAPGGSCVCRREAMEHLRKLGTVVYLSLSFDHVVSRIHNLATRGIALEPGQTLQDVYDYRVPLYEKYAHLTVAADGQSLADTVETVRQTLAAHHCADQN